MPRVTFKDVINLFENLRKTNSLLDIMQMELEIKNNQLYAIEKEKEKTK